VLHQGVDHDVADQVDLLPGDALALQIPRTARLGAEEQVADRVREDPVDLLGHAAVEAAQAGLDVHQRDAQLHGDQAAGDRAVHVAHHEHGVRPVLEQHRLEALHDLGRLHRVRAAADAEVQVRLRDSELPEEQIAHVRVVVLPRVHEQRFDFGARCEGLHQGGYLHQVRARADHVHDLHRPPLVATTPRISSA
jgi:hypothetical protein